MFYESELRFLCATFKKCRVQVSFINCETAPDKILDEGFKGLFGEINSEKVVKEFLADIKPFTIYKAEMPFKLNYIFLLLPQMSESTLMVIGPYMPHNLPTTKILEVGEKFGVSPHNQKLLERYYGGVPIVEENDSLFFMLESFAEHIWGGNNSYSIEEITYEPTDNVLPLNKSDAQSREILLNMQIMEERYAFENELMQAVANGQMQKASMFKSTFSASMFEKRLTDTLRNLKNYCIIMNTILRKAAESGGVHPVHLNDMSSDFAFRIEKLSTVPAGQELMAEMFRSYCRLVRKHSVKNYSAAVQKAIVYINTDLSADLSLSTLAAAQNISAGYLSAVFKRETGKTVTRYITDARIKQAMRLLSTTRLQIQTVALHCGIMDVQYFSKIFKKYTGKTPKEYRESVKK